MNNNRPVFVVFKDMDTHRAEILGPYNNDEYVTSMTGKMLENKVGYVQCEHAFVDAYLSEEQLAKVFIKKGFTLFEGLFNEFKSKLGEL